MKVIVFGCQQIAVDFISYLTSLKNIELPLIVSSEFPIDKTYNYKSVLEQARALNIDVVNALKITDKLVETIRQINPEIIFSVYYRRIFPKQLLSIPKLGCVNVHPSLLPKYRGMVPTAWAIMNAEKETGVTIHLMDEGIDTGDILVQKEFEIHNDETGYQLNIRAMKIGFELLKENFFKIIEKKLTPKKQTGTGRLFGKLKAKYIIDWHQNAENIRNLIRVRANPYVPAETLLFNRYLLINKASKVKDKKYAIQHIGRIIDILNDDKLVVSCADGCLLLEEYKIVPALTDLEKASYINVGNRFCQ